ncbi:putative RING-H2 finger protein ATL21A [Syzygium oleosum]|uniref:putative RING-H2 finger protein ATL21A n=1 Tax=Syzygium oleosum TaxID=219896 RepID=UPI0024BA94D1|nr:putative RING-H2 finger protein ATL21A [Syzygium oleosum]
MRSPLPSLFLFFLCFAHGTTDSHHHDGCCAKRCRHGPEVRFPFWLKNRQSPECGYRDFNLSCDRDGQTKLSVPNTPQGLVVENIDYHSQFVILQDPTKCLPFWIPNLSLLGFSAYKEPSSYQDPYNYTLFKCPSPERTEMTELACRSEPGSYKVYAVDSSTYVGEWPLVYCERNGSLDWLPNPISSMIAKARFDWKEPDCSECTKDRLCRRNGSNIECIPRPHGHPGIVLI